MSKWKTLNSQSLYQTGFFRLRVDECELPDGRIMPRYYVLEFPDWVNVVPVTKDGQMVLLSQYRQGAARDFLEIPGGSTDPRAKEEPRVAAARELKEETGYESGNWFYCGHHFPNPALQNNKMHTFIAWDCEKTSEPNLDPFEDLEVITMNVDEALKRWREGGFSHSLIAASIGLALKELESKGFKA